MKILSTVFFLLFITAFMKTNAQEKDIDDRNKDPRGFMKENLFTGGTINAGFGGNTFAIGANPMLGYSVSEWSDVGVVINFSYSSINNYQGRLNDKLRQTNYGGGFFARLYPARFLFLQGQFEHNIITQKYLSNVNPPEKISVNANSILLGVGVATARQTIREPFFYLSLLFDAGGSPYSPYINAYGKVIPIFKAGVQVPLFQGRKKG